MYAGIDYDTNCVHVVLLPEEGPPRYFWRDLEGMDAFERARRVREVMPARGAWRDWGVIALGLEEQNSMNPRMRNSVQKLKVIQGAILACLPADLLVNPMNAAHWRKTIGLPGNSTKDEVADELLSVRRFGLAAFEMDRGKMTPDDLEAWPQDAYDALGMALAVQRLCEPVPA